MTSLNKSFNSGRSPQRYCRQTNQHFNFDFNLVTHSPRTTFIHIRRIYWTTMETTSSLLKSVTQRVWAAPQRPFRVCSWNRETRKGVTAATLRELKQRAAQALLIPTLLSLVCEEDGTEVDSDEFFMSLPDNTVFMGLEPGQIWKPHALSQKGSGNIRPADNKPRTGRDIARVTFDLYRLNPKDLFGSLSVKATFQGLYSVSADFQCLGPKKVLRETLKMISHVLQVAGHMLITTASVIRRIIQGTDLLQVHAGRDVQIEQWNSGALAQEPSEVDVEAPGDYPGHCSLTQRR